MSGPKPDSGTGFDARDPRKLAGFATPREAYRNNRRAEMRDSTPSKASKAGAETFGRAPSPKVDDSDKSLGGRVRSTARKIINRIAQSG